MLEVENKLNVQLRRMNEQKDNNKQQPSITTSHSSSCSTCSELRQLLEIEKQNNLQLTKQCQSQKKQREEERYSKEVLNIFT